jgi:hypothetical protein
LIHPGRQDDGVLLPAFPRVYAAGGGGNNSGAGAAGAVSYSEHKPKTPPPDLPSLLLDSRIVYLGMPVRFPLQAGCAQPFQPRRATAAGCLRCARRDACDAPRRAPRRAVRSAPRLRLRVARLAGQP